MSSKKKKKKELRNAAALLKVMSAEVLTSWWACEALDYVTIFPKMT